MRLAVNAPLVDTRFPLVVTPAGIERLTFTYDEEEDFHPVEDPFVAWIARDHPDHNNFGKWATVEEARQQGLLEAGYAPEWAAYLAANNCTYLDDCLLISLKKESTAYLAS